MFTSLRIHGTAASILWGYRPAATLRSWSIQRNAAGAWVLTATAARVDAFMARQKPLLFTAPREGAHDGWWAWGCESVTVDGLQVRAMLGPPEQ